MNKKTLGLVMSVMALFAANIVYGDYGWSSAPSSAPVNTNYLVEAYASSGLGGDASVWLFKGSTQVAFNGPSVYASAGYYGSEPSTGQVNFAAYCEESYGFGNWIYHQVTIY